MNLTPITENLLSEVNDIAKTLQKKYPLSDFEALTLAMDMQRNISGIKKDDELKYSLKKLTGLMEEKFLKQD